MGLARSGSAERPSARSRREEEACGDIVDDEQRRNRPHNPRWGRCSIAAVQGRRHTAPPTLGCISSPHWGAIPGAAKNMEHWAKRPRSQERYKRSFIFDLTKPFGNGSTLCPTIVYSFSFLVNDFSNSM
jgi:hypothetical protein